MLKQALFNVKRVVNAQPVHLHLRAVRVPPHLQIQHLIQVLLTPRLALQAQLAPASGMSGPLCWTVLKKKITKRMPLTTLKTLRRPEF